MKKFALILLTVLLLPFSASAQDASSTPSTGDPYQFQRQGIFDCNQNGSYAMSVGALGAIGGAYVPTADAAVELNSGTLVYKECVLREVVDREREDATSALVKQINNDVQTGRNGNPQYVVNEDQESLTGASDPAMLATLQDTALWNQVNPDLQGPEQHALALLYEGERSGEQTTSVQCPYQASLQTYWSGQAYNSSTFFTDFLNASQPQCDPVTENFLLQDVADARIARAVQYQQDMWNWGGGFYARVDQNGNVITPAVITQQLYSQALQSPFNQLQSANDIGQMVGALFGGISTQVLGSSNGLAGLSQSVGGQPSYMDQVATESSQGLQGAAQNAALQILNAQQQIETAFYQAAVATLQSLTQTQAQLQGAEGQCWLALIPKVCATPLKSDKTCTAVAFGPCTTDDNGVQTCPTGPTLQVATSTAFSSAVIATQITPLIAGAQQDVANSQAALQQLNTLIQGVTNTTSLDAQRIAFQQVDALVAGHKLHSETELQNEVAKQGSTSDNMATLLQTVARTWGGSGTDGSGNFPWDGTTNPGNGWCNVTNQTTDQSWIQTWKKN